jgi:hypothetical protein
MFFCSSEGLDPGSVCEMSMARIMRVQTFNYFVVVSSDTAPCCMIAWNVLCQCSGSHTLERSPL